ncbi:MAG TPA: hypothetical protein P5567_05335 [Kiritimatiellia bacterium]|nr:hypothetical protein [Kiritimatiellia bacterium]HRZ11860.1 hypothetical protein [Kiritimatiellia bacterium]HSA17334.1 hypothetical protein [Kiritimatiellia bacterium]
MFTHGLLTAIVVSLAWMLLQLAAMHIRPARNRFYAMLTGYLCSLPFVYAAYRWLPLPVDAQTDVEGWFGLGLFHAYLFHLLLFFLYVEFFYHVERSVTLRFLVMVLQAPGRTAHPADLQQDYSLEDMITRRLADLEQNRFIERRGGRWHDRARGVLIAVIMGVSSWLFRSKTQSERL